MQENLSAFVRALAAARELCFIVGRHIADGCHVATYANDARVDGVLPTHSNPDSPLDEKELELLGDDLDAQLKLAKCAAADEARELFAQAHLHLSCAATCIDIWRTTMHLRIVETATAMILAAINKREHVAAMAAAGERAEAAAKAVRQ